MAKSAAEIFLNLNLSLNQSDRETGLKSLLEQEVQGLHGRKDENEDQLALHGRRYDARGGLLQWTPERKKSPPPKPTFD